jgi:hypothetical protein
MKAGGILPVFKGRLIHDFWKPCFRLECAHGLCNPHLLRELQALSDLDHQPWTSDLSQLLLDMNEFSKTQKVAPSAQDLDPWLKRYEAILQAGWKLNPILPSSNPPKRGRPKHSKAQNLLDRMQTHRDSILAFLFDPAVPFSNNLAEQDIRMLKVQQKISGCFRTLKGAQHFCRIRSYLSTARKQGKNIFNAIVSAMSGQPFISSPSLPPIDLSSYPEVSEANPWLLSDRPSRSQHQKVSLATGTISPLTSASALLTGLLNNLNQKLADHGQRYSDNVRKHSANRRRLPANRRRLVANWLRLVANWRRR